MKYNALKVEGLSKKFIIGHQKSNDFRTAFAERFSNLVGGLSNDKEEFWALKNISFEITKGEAVGVIGRNGAGKSTLLKILSRISYPTLGRFEINGRVSSLLEVGTGFHQELTGRENIYLNGTILGMKRIEIKAKFDQIVEFSGIEKFLDTPVKHYSSGMKVRLAFSVAAHLEPEILIVDEVLAVGDYEFQKKCVGKMDEVSKNEGRTILFVSHNMNAVERLCTRSIVLNNGQIDFIGNVQDAVTEYTKNNTVNKNNVWTLPTRDTQAHLEITRISVLIIGEQPELKIKIETQFVSNGQHLPAFIAYDVLSVDNEPILQSIPDSNGFIHPNKHTQTVISIVDLPPLIPGTYRLSVWIGSDYAHTYSWIKDAVSFDVTHSPIAGRTYPHSKGNGYLVAPSYLLSYEKPN